MKNHGILPFSDSKKSKILQFSEPKKSMIGKKSERLDESKFL